VRSAQWLFGHDSVDSGRLFDGRHIGYCGLGWNGGSDAWIEDFFRVPGALLLVLFPVSASI
jgi:hypothetical protein